MGVETIAVGGMCDHVHVLIRFPPAVAITTIVGRLKGASSHLVTHVIRHPEAFKWQGGYGAFTVSRFGIPRVRDYVLNQERHHREGTLIDVLEATE
jgi:REP element-mobilizing transposase RayT